ncbi:MAG: 2-C-methyl-D-erythritol 4-phosphate cytidylyltransferase [bacterium]|nr:2-C-methyl-D-erythritol 4-phosphate cytidylyltransferase [bacterium]
MGKVSAVVLAAGQGKRMGSRIHKQYLLLEGKPILYYCLKAFEDSAVEEIVLVVGKGEIPYCQTEIAEKFGFHKIKAIVEGGSERYHSVYEGLRAISRCEIVLIHDGARPFVSLKNIQDAIEGARKYQACVLGMPVKDTIKRVDGENVALETPDRRYLWQIQTPQAFSYELIRKAYDLLMGDEQMQQGITDDAMVAEKMLQKRVKIIEGDYSNMKVTTPEDMTIAAALWKALSTDAKERDRKYDIQKSEKI